jgi:predicted RNA-binding protein
MNYWIFTVTGHRVGGETITAEEIFNRRMEDGFWGVGEKTPNRRSLTRGDRVVFYIGLPRKVFAGTAILASSCFKLNDSQKREYGHGRQFYTAEYGVLLEEIDVWRSPKHVEEFVPKLKFIENKEFWFSYFQGGIRQITEEDFKTIVGERGISLVEQIVTSEDVESQTEFALEAHLEEFIHQNWPNINWGSKLELYKIGEQDGRQFPAGTWSIDFLAIDKDKNDLVVIELKRGKTSDSIVGQLLRYINWVKENVAEEGQNVRGIIVAKDVDDALSYAVKNLENVEVKTYKVDFQLLPFKK